VRASVWMDAQCATPSPHPPHIYLFFPRTTQEAADAAAFHARVAAASSAADAAACDDALARCDTRAAWLAEVVDGAGLLKKGEEGERNGGGGMERLAAALAAAAAPAPPHPAAAAAAASAERTATFAAILRALQQAQTPEDLAAADAAYEVMRGQGGGLAATSPPPTARPARGPPLGPGLWPVSLPGGAPPPPGGAAAEL